MSAKVNQDNGSNHSDMLDERMVNWIIWKVIAPFGLLMLIYPVYKYIVHMDDQPFGKAFAHGDLLIFSALVLIEVALEYKHFQLEEAQHSSLKLRAFLEIIRVVAFFLIFVFGFMKYDVVSHERKMEIDQISAASDRLTLYSCFSCSIAIVSVVFSIYVFWKITHINTQIRLRNAKSME